MKIVRVIQAAMRDHRIVSSKEMREEKAAQRRRLNARARRLRDAARAIRKNPRTTRWSLDGRSYPLSVWIRAAFGRPFVYQNRVLKLCCEQSGTFFIGAASGWGGNTQCMTDAYGGFPTLLESVKAIGRIAEEADAKGRDVRVGFKDQRLGAIASLGVAIMKENQPKVEESLVETVRDLRIKKLKIEKQILDKIAEQGAVQDAPR